MSGTVLKQYIVDAFTDTVFKGNPAAICVLDQWLPDNLMQSITKENNLSETAFTVKNGENYDLRWFTPGGEIDLCGHATLACAYVLMNYYEQGKESVAFSTMSGKLTVVRRGNLGVEDADLAHGAGFSADLDEIADLERVRGKKDHGAGKIGKRVLNGKGNGKTCNAQNGKQR